MTALVMALWFLVGATCAVLTRAAVDRAKAHRRATLTVGEHGDDADLAARHIEDTWVGELPAGWPRRDLLSKNQEVAAGLRCGRRCAYQFANGSHCALLFEEHTAANANERHVFVDGRWRFSQKPGRL